MIAPPQKRFGATQLFAPAIDRLVPRSVLVRRGPAERRRVALTFDDGPHELTSEYLDLLGELGVPATFFVVGELCIDRRAELDQMVRAGHEVGGHGFSHRAFPRLTRAVVMDELVRTTALLPSASRLVRPPFGEFSPRSILFTALAGYTTCLWSLDSDDCRTERAADVAGRVSAGIAPGDIVLLHEGQRWTLEALPQIVRALKEASYSLVTVSALIRG